MIVDNLFIDNLRLGYVR